MGNRYEEARLFVLNDSQVRLCPALAVEIGMNESILFLQFEYLIAIKGVWLEGRKWLRMSIRDLELEFPFWSSATINRAIQSLESRALIRVENFNERKYDKTRWLAINLDGASKLESIAIKGPDKPPQKEEKPPEEPPPMLPSEEQKTGGHETRSTQNETGSAQIATRSTQNETTIDREVIQENKSLERTHTHVDADPHETGLPLLRVCVPEDLTFENYRDFARGTPTFTNPDGWARVAFKARDPADDFLVREWLESKKPEAIAEARAAPVSQNLFLHQALHRIEIFQSRGDDPLKVIEGLPLDDDVRRQLIEKFSTVEGQHAASG